jgi:hypothetical protein
MFCWKRVRGVVFFKKVSEFQVGRKTGLSFYYAHLVCFREAIIEKEGIKQWAT